MVCTAMPMIGRLRPILPVFGLLALFLALLLLTVFKIAGEANIVDAERSRTAVSVGVTSNAERMAGIARDNANYDDSVIAAYRGRLDAKYFHDAIATATADHTNYDAAYLVDYRGQTLWAAIDGKVATSAPLNGEMAVLAQSVSAKKPSTGGVLHTPLGLALVGVSAVVPTDPGLFGLVPEAGPHRLILLRRLTPEVLRSAGQRLLLDDLRLNGVGPGRLAIEVAVRGAPFTLSWRPGQPGREAIMRALPLLIIALIVFAAICAMILRGAFASVQELARQAVIDSLSRLPNRRALHRALHGASRKNAPLALALLDLDGFKAINDNYGHAVGDRLIRAVGDALSGLARGDILVARLGGDEFALLAQGSHASDRLHALSEAVLARLGHPFRIDQRTLVVGGSIGMISRNPDDRIAPTELLRRADVAMYAAKRAGKMRVMAFDAELDRLQSAKHLIEIELRAAIAAREFDVVYQPLMAADRTTIQGVEALVRWTSPTRGPLSPDVFIPIAEETGLIDRIGMFVLDRACTDALAWPDLNLAVNVSAAQLRNPDFPAQLGTILTRTGFPPGRLEIEITETYLVREADTARSVLDGLRALGVTISLDDFGTGFASIGFLRQFTFDKLKIDRSLVADAEHSEAARAMVQASVAVARALAMSVTAEGVETLGQADVMRVVGCDELQGWLFATAVSAADLSVLMAEDRPPPRRARR